MNNIRTIINILGLKNKDVASELNISIQALNSVLSSKNPRKYNRNLSKLWNIDEIYITKELTEEDEKNIVIQYHNLYGIAPKDKDIRLFKHDELISIDELIDIFNDWNIEDYININIKFEMDGISIPNLNIKNAEFEVTDSKFNIFSNYTYDTFSIEKKLIKEIIGRFYNPDLKRLIMSLYNGINITITKSIDFTEEDE